MVPRGRTPHRVRAPTIRRDVDFFSLLPSGIDFPGVMRRIFALPVQDAPTGRVQRGDGYVIWLSEYRDDDEYCEGMIVRLRMADLPRKGSVRTNRITPLNLQADEGLAEETFFLYAKQLGVLCMVSAKNGVKMGTFGEYVRRIGAQPEFGLNILLSPDALQVFRSWRHYTSIEFSVGIANDFAPSAQAVQNAALRQVMREAHDAGSSRVKIELYNPKLRGGLIAGAVRTIGEQVRRLGGALDPLSIAVKGSASAAQADTIIDLITQRYKVPVTLRGSGRHLDFDECSRVTKDRVRNNAPVIRSLLR